MTDLYYGDLLPPTPEAVEGAAKSVLVGTASPVTLRVRRMEHHLTPGGSECIGTYLADRLIGRCAVPGPAAEDFLDMELFSRPVPLALNVRERERVLEGNLLALVPAAEVQADEPAPESEPWRDSVPGAGYDDAGEAGEGEEQLVGVFLGQVVRFGEDRRFPDSLPREAADMLAGVVRGRIGNVVDRVLQDLGGSP